MATTSPSLCTDAYICHYHLADVGIIDQSVFVFTEKVEDLLQYIVAHRESRGAVNLHATKSDLGTH